MPEHEDGEPRFGTAAQAAEWDARYREPDKVMWSGRPNGRLVAEVSDLTPGRALDVGCGEGADAIWLSRRGWMVTAIDISDVAVARAREAAERPAPKLSGVRGRPADAVPDGSFHLVSMQYPALSKDAGEAAVRTLSTPCAREGRRSPCTTTSTTNTPST